MIALLVSWALTLVGLMIESNTGALWVAVVMTAIGVLVTWFWNVSRSHGKLALILTILPHAALWIVYKMFPEVGDKITFYASVVLGVIAVLAGIIMEGGESFKTETSSVGRGSNMSYDETNLSNMPVCISSGTANYGLRNNFGWGVEYVNESDSGDVITITNVYSRTGTEMSTNAGHFSIL